MNKSADNKSADYAEGCMQLEDMVDQAVSKVMDRYGLTPKEAAAELRRQADVWEEEE